MKMMSPVITLSSFEMKGGCSESSALSAPCTTFASKPVADSTASGPMALPVFS
jgi:hypothetical protein